MKIRNFSTVFYQNLSEPSSMIIPKAINTIILRLFFILTNLPILPYISQWDLISRVNVFPLTQSSPQFPLYSPNPFSIPVQTP